VSADQRIGDTAPDVIMRIHTSTAAVVAIQTVRNILPLFTESVCRIHTGSATIPDSPFDKSRKNNTPVRIGLPTARERNKTNMSSNGALEISPITDCIDGERRMMRVTVTAMIHPPVLRTMIYKHAAVIHRQAIDSGPTQFVPKVLKHIDEIAESNRDRSGSWGSDFGHPSSMDFARSAWNTVRDDPGTGVRASGT